MADPSLRQLLEYARPVRDFAQTLQTALRLVEAAVEAEAALANATARSQEALRRAQEAEIKAAQNEADVVAQREILLAPVRQELVRLGAEATAVKERIDREKTAFDEERGRRTSIMRALEEQVAEARKRNEEHLIALKHTAKTEEDQLNDDLKRLRIQIEETKRDLEGLRAEYRAVQQAAAKLAGR